jgi:hypothetical protein
VTSAKMTLAPGQKASKQASSWLWAATRWSTRSSRARTAARRALVSSLKGASTLSLWDLSRRYSEITSASPGSSLAPETTSDSRHALMALPDTGTTGWPASNKASTSRPSGRSIATGTRSTGPSLARRLTRPAKPSRLCLTANELALRPLLPSTHTACSSLAQSIPT